MMTILIIILAILIVCFIIIPLIGFILSVTFWTLCMMGSVLWWTLVLLLTIIMLPWTLKKDKVKMDKKTKQREERPKKRETYFILSKKMKKELLEKHNYDITKETNILWNNTNLTKKLKEMRNS